MKIICALAWFNESPSWLAALVASVARIADHLVAVDGRYALFEHEFPISPVSEAEVIVEAAEGAALALTLHRPNGPFWGNEVEKRSLLMRLAMVHAEPMEDWVFVIDGDQYIRHVSAEWVRKQLAETDLHAAELAVEEYLDTFDPQMPIKIAQIRHIETVAQTDVRLIYRAIPNLRYEGTHYSVCGEIDGAKTWLWGHPQQVEALRLADDLIVRHRNVLRTVERRMQASAYYEARDQLEVEKPVTV